MLQRFVKKRRRTEEKYVRVETFWGFLVTAAAVILYSAGAFKSLEYSIFDSVTRLRGPLPPPPEIAIIEINQESVDTIGKWPLPRDVYAHLIDILARAGASAVGINLIFSEESTRQNDRELAAAIGRAGMVYLPCHLESIPRGNQFVRLIQDIPSFRDAARAQGLVNMPADPDGVTRHAILSIPFKNERYWQLAFLMARDRLGADARGVGGDLSREVEIKTSRGQTVAIPVDRTCAMLIDWNGPWRRAFRSYTLADIFESAAHADRKTRPRVPLENLKDKICLVGLTAPGAFDIVRTPFEAMAPSIAVHANIISQILARRFVTTPARNRTIAAIVLMGMAVSLAIPRLRPGTAILATLAACACYVAFFLVMFLRYRVQATVVYPVSTALAAYLTMSIHHEIYISLERARLLNLATRDGLTGLYVVGHARLLLEAEIVEALRLRSPLTLVMADVDHFKKVNDAWGHPVGDFVLKETARILQASCRELDIVGRYGGEEFILVLPDTGLAAAKGVAERIRSTVERHPFTHAGKDHTLTLSLGLAELAQFDTAEDLIARADNALYAAKRGGRNRVCEADPAAKPVKTISLG